MSWSAYIPSATIGALAPALATATTSPPTLTAEALEQFEAAKDAFIALVDSGAVGAPGAIVNVSLSGHANPGHVPAVGWANDCISVSVTQA